MKRIKLLIFVIVGLFIVSSCGVSKTGKTPSVINNESNGGDSLFSEGEDDGSTVVKTIRKKMKHAATSLSLSLRKRNTTPDQIRCIVTTFVDLNDLQETSQFGRTATEELMTALSNEGFNPLEVRIGRDLVIVDKKGEFLLTRKVKELTKKYNANSFVVATYSLIKKKALYMNVRIIRAADMEVYAAVAEDIKIEEEPLISKMLRSSATTTNTNSRWYGVQDH
ncbi:MAG: hypothetical protein HQK84_09120 [Nitrospinae bacterium]|nr:hypothetical protein [Nitrospinota bacterium]